MLGPDRKNPARAQSLAQIVAWTRERFGLAQDATLFVAEIECGLPGCPPLETVVAFWIGERRHQFKVFKPLEQVAQEDLPYAWLKDALAVAEGAEFYCC